MLHRVAVAPQGGCLPFLGETPQLVAKELLFRERVEEKGREEKGRVRGGKSREVWQGAEQEKTDKASERKQARSALVVVVVVVLRRESRANTGHLDCSSNDCSLRSMGRDRAGRRRAQSQPRHREEAQSVCVSAKVVTWCFHRANVTEQKR